MLKAFFSLLFGNPPAPLRWYYQIQYGPYLKKNPLETSESFYTNLNQTASKYLTKNDIVLDAGCGLGRLTIEFGNKHVQKIIGIDKNKTFIQEAEAIAGGHRTNILTLPCKGNYEFMVADIENLPFADNYFTFISCVNVLDRVYDPKRCIQELTRVLKPNGLLFFCDPYDWFDSPAPVEKQCDNVKELITKTDYSIVHEEDSLPFTIYINPRRTTNYKNHLAIIKKH